MLISVYALESQKTGISANALTRGAKNKSVGATKSLSSAVNDDEARVFINILLNGLPQISPDTDTTGSRPNLVMFTENSINWSAIYLPFVWEAGPGLVYERLLSCNINPKGPAHVLLADPKPV